MNKNDTALVLFFNESIIHVIKINFHKKVNIMKKMQKKQAEDFIRLLEQAHNEIKEKIIEGKMKTAQDLLSQCQQGAIELGNLIEATEGEGFVTISYLEKYCEIVYRIYQEIETAFSVNAEKIFKNLRKTLLQIENSVRNDIPLRKEIVFFPYKASMWDSLESVYLAAKKEPGCDVYCVPIPYYDRNSDGSLGQMHYEGLQYPENIQVMDWQTYNFEERKPDTVYIHNPYDDRNFVTCVHPRYFSRNLKKYTEKLIYIPYFVLPEVDPKDQVAIEKMKHFCFLPGTIYADQVIVQSEAMRQIYINEYMKEAKAHGMRVTRKELEEKFLGLGSPKFDKVINTKKEDLKIPKEWLRIIQKPDGSWKKIILYNTSVSAFLAYNEKMLEKMRCVFRTFKQNQNDVALVWRPHPLIPTTINSMRPQLWIEYKKIVEAYKAEGWGIYDDTTDMDRAVVLSDAYFGDQSSVVEVYHKTGKILGIQEVMKREENIKIAFMDVLFLGEEIWFSAANRNGLFKYNYSSKELVCVGIFPNERSDADFLHSEIKRYGNKLVFIPFQAKNICVYDLEEDSFENIELPQMSRGQNYSKFYTAIQEENLIYMIPCRYGGIIKYDVKNKDVQIIDEPFEGKSESTPIAMKAGCKVKESIYIASFTEGIIEELDLTTKMKKRYSINFCEKGISNLTYYRDIFWLTNNEGELIAWDKDTQRTEYIKKLCNKGRAPHAIFEIKCKDNALYIASSIEKKIYRYDISDKKINVVYEEEDRKKEFFGLWADFCALTITPKNKFAFFSSAKAQFIVLGEKIEALEWEFRMAKGYYKKLSEANRGGKLGIIAVDEREFIDWVCNG